MANLCALPWLVVGLSRLTWSFSFDESGPVNYCSAGIKTDTCKAKLDLFVNRLTSDRTVIPFAYNHFDFCSISPSREVRNDFSGENLGRVLLGDRIRQSSYNIKFKKHAPTCITDDDHDHDCLPLCTKNYSGSDPESLKRLDILKNGIKLDYRHHWIVDNIPVTRCSEADVCALEFPIGCYLGEIGSLVSKDCLLIDDRYRTANTYVLFNHVHLIITYRRGDGPYSAQILSVRVKPKSIWHCDTTPNWLRYLLDPNGTMPIRPMTIPERRLAPNEVISVSYTYSYTFVEDKRVEWSSRWDYILSAIPNTKTTWYQHPIVKAVIILPILFMTFMNVLRRMLRPRPEEGAEPEPSLAVSGTLELTKGEEFLFAILAAFVCTGVQLLMTAIVILTLGNLGLFSPANSGALTTTILVLFGCFGMPGGYVAARVHKGLGGGEMYQRGTIILTGLLCPGIMYGLFNITNSILLGLNSSGYLPGWAHFTVVGIWFGLSLPLTYFGGHLGLKIAAIKTPLQLKKVGAGTKHSSKVGWRAQIAPNLICAVFCGCVHLVTFILLDSIWKGEGYQRFGILVMVSILFVLVCSELVVRVCYPHLQDHNWQWRSFLTTGGYAALNFFAFSILYFVFELNIEWGTSTLLYFLYAIMMTFPLFLVTGTVGFVTCFLLVHNYIVWVIDFTLELIPGRERGADTVNTAWTSKEKEGEQV